MEKDETTKKEIEKAQLQVLQSNENAQEKQGLIDLTSQLRMWVTHTHTRFNSLKKKFEDFRGKEKAIDVLYEKICNPEKASFVPSHKDIKEYCEAMHDLLNERIIADALTDAQSMYANISQAYQQTEGQYNG